MSASGWSWRLRGPALRALEPDDEFHAHWQILSLHGSEAVNSLFHYRLCLRHPRLAPDLRPMLGRELQIHMVPPGEEPGRGMAARRVISALVSQVEHLGCGGAMHSGGAGAWRARLTLRPWPCLAECQTACRIHQERTVPEVLEQVLRPYGFAWELRLRRAHARLDYLVQFNLSDWEFVESLCARWGLHYHFEHDAGGHRLVFGDGEHAWQAQPLDAFSRLRSRVCGWSGDAAALHDVRVEVAAGVQAWQSGTQSECHPERVEIWRHDAPAANPQASAVSRWRGIDGVCRARREIEPGSGSSESDASSESELNRAHLQQARHGVSLVRARGPLGGLCAARTVHLDLEPSAAPGRETGPTHLVLASCLRFQAGTPDGAFTNSSRVEVEFVAQRLHDGVAAVAPPRRRRALGTQTATVLEVLLPGSRAGTFTDPLGRLKVRLHWARRDDAAATCWLRMARPAAGDGHGCADWPRPGQEVLVDFVDGDVDMPICLGCVRNATHEPPWPLPATRAVSGWRSRELSADSVTAAHDAANHLLFDDTSGALQVQLASSSHASALQLGRHAPLDARSGRGDDRGEGFELRTRAHAAIRAARALLLVRAATAEAAASILHPLRACHERLKQALRTRRMGSVGHDAERALARGATEPLAEDLHGLEPPGEAAQAGALASGAMAWRADGALHAATPRSGALAAGSHLACSAQRDLDAACLRGLRMHAEGAAVLAAAGDGARLHAADGALLLGAASGELQLFARNAVRLQAARRGTRLQAGARVVVQACGQRIEFGPCGVRHASQGAWRIHAGRRSWGTQAQPGTASTTAHSTPDSPRP